MVGVMNVKRCGACHFGRVQGTDLSKRMCYGGPPAVVTFPAGPGKIQIQMFRPMVNVTDDACALYRERIVLETGLVQMDTQEIGTKQ